MFHQWRHTQNVKRLSRKLDMHRYHIIRAVDPIPISQPVWATEKQLSTTSYTYPHSDEDDACGGGEDSGPDIGVARVIEQPRHIPTPRPIHHPLMIHAELIVLQTHKIQHRQAISQRIQIRDVPRSTALPHVWVRRHDPQKYTYVYSPSICRM